jgi:hypothetical protein
MVSFKEWFGKLRKSCLEYYRASIFEETLLLVGLLALWSTALVCLQEFGKVTVGSAQLPFQTSLNIIVGLSLHVTGILSKSCAYYHPMS